MCLSFHRQFLNVVVAYLVATFAGAYLIRVVY